MDAFFETYGRQKLELKSPFSGPVGGERVDVRVVARLAVVPRPGVQVRSVGRREADEELAAADDGEPRVRAAVVVVEAYKKKKTIRDTFNASVSVRTRGEFLSGRWGTTRSQGPPGPQKPWRLSSI